MITAYLPERDLAPLNPRCTLSDNARRTALAMISKVDALRPTFNSSFTTPIRAECAEDQLAEIEALARQARQALRRGR